MFFQTQHERRLIGGYLSRVSGQLRRDSLQTPMLRALYELSERPGPLSDDVRDAALRSRDDFLAKACLEWVVVDKQRASTDLRAFAIDALGLVSVHEDDRYELLTPDQAPMCEPLASGPEQGSLGGTSTGQR
jgi:hypothetical protein